MIHQTISIFLFTFLATSAHGAEISTRCGHLRSYLGGGSTDPSVPYRSCVLTTDSDERYTFEISKAVDYDGEYCVDGVLQESHFESVERIYPR